MNSPRPDEMSLNYLIVVINFDLYCETVGQEERLFMLQEAVKNHQMLVPSSAWPSTSPESKTTSTTLLGMANLLIDYSSTCELIIDQYTQDSFLA